MFDPDTTPGPRWNAFEADVNDRDTAILWAREILQKDFIVLDTETTGLNPDNGDQAVTIGIVDNAGRTRLDARIRPTRPISPDATARHGISNEQAKLFPNLTYYYPQLAGLTGNYPAVVCYCVRHYDPKIIMSTCQAHGLPPIDFRPKLQEALYPFSTLYGEWNDHHRNYKWQSLTVAATYFGISADGAHNAVADALMTLRVVEAMARQKLSGEEK